MGSSCTGRACSSSRSGVFFSSSICVPPLFCLRRTQPHQRKKRRSCAADPGPHCPSARAKLRLFCTTAGQWILRCSAYKKGERSTFRGRSGRIIPSSSTMIRVHCPAFTSTNSFY
ncbi:hypothetical protein DWZ46_08650 [Faecalibacterium prausnitzii]|uniref:Uncharacterized protein n=1 Tax=Faecalibacterium prausnitzii TaxID=853 RepID=A0A3E2U4P9_9FIRM|nr:hypothetical protein DWZ46_08650 [Faecalibacterium prausnitzii]